MGNDWNPYTKGNIFNNILPLGYLTFLFLGFLTLIKAFYVYVFISLITYYYGIRLVCSSAPKSANILWTFALLNIPLMWCLDRGAPVLFVVSLYVLAITKLMNGDKNSKHGHFWMICVAFCMSAKIYLFPAVLILLFGKALPYRKSLIICTYFVLGNLACSFIYTGPLNAMKQISVSLNATPGIGLSNVAGSVNFANLFERVANGVHMAEKFQQKAVTIISILSFLLAVMVAVMYRNKAITIIMSLSMVQYFASVSFRYTEIWAVFAIYILLSSNLLDTFRERRNGLYRYLLIALTVTLLPLPNNMELFVSVGWVVAIVLLLLPKNTWLYGWRDIDNSKIQARGKT